MPALDNKRARRVRGTVWTGGALALVLIASGAIDAHKAVTSKYMYNEDVFPILRDKCGSCHVDGGPAPMSLLTYKDNGGAVAWAESIREMLVSEAMPPWYVDPTGPLVKGGRGITPRELDIVVTWAAGGTPQGDPGKTPAAATARAQWILGPPDLTLAMEKEHTLGPNVAEETHDVTLPSGLTEARWVKAADLLPGTSSMVRRAVISVENGPVLAVWEPGHDAIAAPGGTAFRLPANARLHLQIHYKKPWQDEQTSKSDRSTVGLYFTDEPLSGREIQAFADDGPRSETAATGPLTFSGRTTAAGRVLAVRPSLDQPYAALEIRAQLPSGRKVPLLKLRAARPEWPRRYWLADPIELPANTTIEIVATPGANDEGPLVAPSHETLKVSFDFVGQ
jgi:hypothetical protein